MKLGFVIPSYPCENRVALLPQDIVDFPDELIVENGFGRKMGIDDSEYENRDCKMATRGDVFAQCDTIFALKLLQPSDYAFIRNGQMIVGWTHPTGSGTDFMHTQAVPKNLRIADLDSTCPKMYYDGVSVPIPFLPKNFLCKNSFYAGFASTMHAFLNYGSYPNPNLKIAVLGNGNTSQGVFHFLSKFTDNIRMYYRKTMPEFKAELATFDVIVNGIEVDVSNYHLLSKEEIEQTKMGCFFIDAAADAGNTIEGTHYTSIANPIYEENGRFFYEVNNSPSLVFRPASMYLSSVLSKLVFQGGISRFWNLSITK